MQLQNITRVIVIAVLMGSALTGCASSGDTDLRRAETPAPTGPATAPGEQDAATEPGTASDPDTASDAVAALTKICAKSSTLFDTAIEKVDPYIPEKLSEGVPADSIRAMRKALAALARGLTEQADLAATWSANSGAAIQDTADRVKDASQGSWRDAAGLAMYQLGSLQSSTQIGCETGMPLVITYNT